MGDSTDGSGAQGDPSSGEGRERREVGGDGESPGRLAVGPINIRSVALTGLLVIAVFHTLHVASSVLMPIMLAVVITVTLTPVTRAMGRLRVPSVVTALFVTAGGVGLIVGATYLLAQPIAAWAERLPDLLRELEFKTRDIQESVKGLGEMSERVGEVVEGGKGGPGDPIEVSLRDRSLARAFVFQTGTVAINSAVVLALVFFLIAAGDRFLVKLVHVIPSLRQKVKAVTIVREIQRDVSVYVSTIAVVNIGLGIVTGFAMHLMGLGDALLWGVMAALFNFVPYLGAVAGMMVIGLVGFGEFDSAWRTFTTMGVYYGLTAIEGTFITPMLLGRRLTLNPLMIFVSLLLWGWLWGIVGVFLAVPILAGVKILCDRIESLAFVGEFLGR